MKITLSGHIKKEENHLKKALVILLAMAFVLGMSAVALAVDPVYDAGNATFTESAPQAGSNIGTSATAPSATKYGASAWVYKDKYDADFKFEGSYREFQNQTGTGSSPQGGYGAGYYDFDTDTVNAAGDGWATGGYDSGPHDGYDTGSNKCKTCHAVHRASGSYRLMRVDNPDDACAYCHIGDHKHATRGAYYGNNDSVYPTNGHTMGAGPSIPDSSVKQWLQSKTLDYVDSDGTTKTMTYKVREYNNTRNKLYYWSGYRSSYHDNGWNRMGPTYLTCISCHQPHNAQELVWKPVSGTAGYPRGYKLLRAAPSGSTKSTARQVAGGTFSGYWGIAADAAAGSTTVDLKAAHGSGDGPAAYVGDVIHLADADSHQEVNVTAVAAGNVITFEPALTDALSASGGHAGLGDGNLIKAPEGTIVKEIFDDPNTATNEFVNGTGNGLSTNGDGSDITQNDGALWTAWKGANFPALDNAHGVAMPRLSVWCADCHNLNIGHYESVGTAGTTFRASAIHSDRTHTSSGSRIDCWNCHTTNMPMSDADYTAYFADSGYTPDSAGLSCAKCHYYSNGDAFYRDTRWAVPKSDFPHSGGTYGFKLLTEVTDNTTGGVSTTQTSGGPNLDNLCTRCHDMINQKM